MSAHRQTTAHAHRTATLTVALAGNPNSGKTTIFNALTGLRQKVANYPGVTVEKKTGRCRLPDGRWINIIDLPGTYSLISRSPDERVTMEVLRGLRPDTPAPDVVVCVVDASNLQRNLYLVTQLIELGRPLVIALNMMDVAKDRGVHVDFVQLQQRLGVPVVPIIGHRRVGISDLKFEISNARVAPMPDWPLPEPMKEELARIGSSIGVPSHGDHHVTAERLLIGDRTADIAPLADREPVRSLLTEANQRMHRLGIDPVQADIEAHYHWIEQTCKLVCDGALPGIRDANSTLNYLPAPTLTERIDAIFIHKVWGLLIFAGIMASLFVSLFWLADPIMGFVEGAVAWVGGLVAPILPEGPIQDLWNDGIVAGVGAVIVFVPQIALLFFFLAILEDSGYLARAAFLMDRLLAKVGLHGKSFIPLLSSFACAIPGIMATRTIENRNDRLATIFIAPFMSCAARLPVYILLIGTFFGAYSAFTQAGIMLGLYVLGILAAAATAWIFRRTLLKGGASAFILELPSYKFPQASQIARTVWTNTKQFLIKAGTIIFCLSVVLWGLMYYPRLPVTKQAEVVQSLQSSPPESVRNALPARLPEYVNYSNFQSVLAEAREKALEGEIEKAIAAEQLRYSLAGRFGHAIEPVIRPLGYDWKIGVGLVGAFAAREVFVSTMGIVYSVGAVEDETADLQSAMQADRRPDGRPVWTPLVAVSLLVWFVLAMQCMSTLAIVRRETGSWKWPLAMLLYMNGLAYVVCLIVYQVGSVFFPA